MSVYKSYDHEQLQELFSNFLISSWSYSKAAQFARNEKAFEMQYIFGLYGKRSPTTIAGEAYHAALQYFFAQLKEGNLLDVVELEQSAFQYIEGIDANKWKVSKTCPTIEDCAKKCYDTVAKLLVNFYTEKDTYLDDIDEIIEVEVEGEEFLTVNGVDIPLPCRFKIDLVVKTKSGKYAVADHKSKQSFTDDEEMVLGIGAQAITYALGYEEKSGIKIDEVWFVENKFSKNKDNSPQLNKHVIGLTPDTRRLYEALLYEPVKRMIAAVRDPDYVYLINDSDNFVDRAELYDFWCRTQIQEVEDFNVENSKKELVAKRLKKVRDASIDPIPPSVIKKFKENASKFIQYDMSSKDMTPAQKIEHVLARFATPVRVAHMFDGYSSNTYLLDVSAGIKINSIFGRRLDIANALDVENVRIAPEMVVREGKSYVAIEFKKKRERTLEFNPDDLVGMRLPIGKDNFGNTIVWDLDNHSTPHALICGATGSGKSVCVKSIIEYAIVAGILDIVIFDPKHEFKEYASSGIAVINDIENIEVAMQKLIEKMNNRVQMGGKFNKVLVVFDEFADAVANSRTEKQLKGLNMKTLEENLRILLQKGRSPGFRIVAATQRASVKVITGDAKVNFPVQICFRVPKEVDSKVVIDEAGAESLAGQGDGLIKSPEYHQTVRFQAYYTDKTFAHAEYQ